MRIINKRHLLISLALLAFLNVSSAFAGGKSYAMVCKGGTGMNMGVTNRGDTAHFNISYKKAKFAGTAREPGAGECAWLDRPIAANEPSLLVFKGKNPIIRLSMGKSRVSIAGYARGNAYTPGHTLVTAITRGNKFFLKVRRHGRQFEITKVGL